MDPNTESAIAGQANHAESCVDAFIRAHVGKIAIALAIFAALRVLFFCAAFPLSNNVDERFHLSTIQMYAQGHIPGKDLPRIQSDFSRAFLLYWSPEYGHSQDALVKDGVVGPLYDLIPEARAAALTRKFYADKIGQWSRRPNYEAQSAPLYYLVTAGWYKLGEVAGLKDWRLDYWARFLNPIAFGLLVWFSYKFVREVYPERAFLQLAVPAIIAVFPQDIFFGMNRDVFSAPLAAATLVLLLRAIDSRRARDGFLVLGSFLAGLSFLSSVSNFVLFGATAAIILIWARGSATSIGRKTLVVTASAFAAGLLPCLWMLRNYLVIGDLTGGRAKTHDFGWTVKPLGQLLRHPLFSPHGAGYFLAELTRSFWRGEYVWHNLPMRSVWADRFYIFSSVVFLALFVIDFLIRRRNIPPLQKLAGWQALFLVAGSVLFLAAISLPFDFHDCAYPSRLYPYFVSGRIISGAMLPFALMYASGLELFANRIRKWVPPVAVLACLMVCITASEIRVRKVVFASPYNFFALSGWRR